MQTLRASASLLAAADSLDSLAPLAAAIGCDGHVSPLDRETRIALGIDDFVVDARVVPGRGATRALLVVVDNERTIRDTLPHLASRLSARTPHVLWLVLATQPSSRELAIAAWSDSRRPPRVAALVVHRDRLVDSDGETLRALCAIGAARDLLVHSRWIEILGRESLGVRFYRALDRAVNGLAASSTIGTAAARAEIALLDTSRLLFLSFLEAKGWLNGDAAFLTHQYDLCVTGRGGFHQRCLRPLFFGTLNTPRRQRAPVARDFGEVPFLNGGLFARTPIERTHRGLAFSDDAYGALVYDLFGQYRFTAREESATWTEAAVDPEMLGRAFESLMAAPERRRTGAFFTPFALVERLTNAGLDVALEHNSIDDLTVLDPACGSGAFLVHALERIAARRRERGVDGDASLSDVRRHTLTGSIFGVDVNPTAVWLCQLRLWLSVVIESTETDPTAVVPLPNLDRNVRVGDALSGRAFGDEDSLIRGGAALRRLRHRYARASGPRKDSLSRQLDAAERQRALLTIDAELARVAERRRDLLVVRRGRDLFGERYRPSAEERNAAELLRKSSAALRSTRRRIVAGGALPFSFPVHFAEVATRGGFDLVVGNPPWVRMHHVARSVRADLRRDFEVARNAAWEPGAGQAGAGHGFAAQVDLAAVFIERSTTLLSPRGALSLLVPVKLWRSLAGGGVRRWMSNETTLRCVEDHSEAASAFDAAVYPSIVVASRRVDGQPNRASLEVVVHHRGGHPFTWTARASSLSFDSSPGAPWVLLPPDARRAFYRLRELGRPLSESPIGRPRLGVKCGCNEAFVVKLLALDDELAEVESADGHRGTIESILIRPLVRGEALRRWGVPAGDSSIVWTHDASGAPLRALPPHALRWLTRWRRELDARTDAHRRGRWWSLFRTESARSEAARVVWGDIGREPRAAVLDPGDQTVPLNSCYSVACADRRDAL
ncbi:MAG: N-6 DNA methylase, partial [Gemmatimonadaceae bacterium]